MQQGKNKIKASRMEGLFADDLILYVENLQKYKESTHTKKTIRIYK